MDSLNTVLNLLLVMLGFGFIVFLHELGHFLAARWAGIRVLAFAIGFGPPLVTFRKGLGVRRGSSEREYFERTTRGLGAGISPTEYRINALPFGGYVKMLGQEDLDPTAVSSAPDSYQNCKVWRRMVVISAGVVMNIISALVIFAIVFMVGLKTEPPKIGMVYPGSPAAKARVEGGGLKGGVIGPGLKPGDVVLAVDGEKPDSFNDIITAAAMSGPHDTLKLSVQRAGFVLPLEIEVTPEVNRLSGLRDIGIEPPRTLELPEIKDAASRKLWAEQMSQIGLAGLAPEMRLAKVNGTPVTRLHELVEAINASDGAPVPVEFVSDTGETFAGAMKPRVALRPDVLPKPKGQPTPEVDNLLGLTPVMTVVKPLDRAKAQGLKDGDVLVRVGDVEYPSLWQGLKQISSHPGETLPIVVLRKDDKGELHEVSLPNVKVDSHGLIGFSAGDVGDESTLVAQPPAQLLSLTPPRQTSTPYAPAAVRLIDSPGTQIVSVAGAPVHNLADVRRELRRATREAYERLSATADGKPVDVQVELRQPVQGSVLGDLPTQHKTWSLTSDDLRDLFALGWESPLSTGAFEPEEFLLKGQNPIDAMRLGLRRAKQVMLTTYLTFARLAEGTVKIEHLKGPVGIAHLGTLVASRGLVWLLFFMGLISINLAVINFLPLPIVDGGQFLFLVWEQVRGRPAPIAVQNAATLAGLVFLACVFLVVTFNDIRQLLGL
ncbi:MAG: PDZ domain-containing protein [Tepidisphaera sp.]|nr:PDZ domain-containing protein [Tepidisphaera sp.]